MAGQGKTLTVTILTRAITGGIDEANRAVKDFNQKVENGSRALNAIVSQAVAFIGVRAVSRYVRAADEATRVQNQLTATLRRHSQATPEYIAALNRQSAALERQTGASQESIQTGQRLLIQFGATAENIEELTSLTLDFATHMRMDMASAANLVARSIGEGAQNMLTRYGVALDETLPRQEAMVKALAQFRGEARAAMTPLQRLGTTLSNSGKELGFLALNIGNVMGTGFTAFLEGIEDRLRSVNERLAETGDLGRGVFQGIGMLVRTILLPLSILIAVLVAVRGATIFLTFTKNTLAAATVGATAALTRYNAVIAAAARGNMITAGTANVLTVSLTRLTSVLQVLAVVWASIQVGSFIRELETGGETVGDRLARLMVRAIAFFKGLWEEFRVGLRRELLNIQESFFDLIVTLAEGLNRLPGVDIDIAPLKAKVLEARQEIAGLNSELRDRIRKIDTERDLRLEHLEADIAARRHERRGETDSPGGGGFDPEAEAARERAKDAALKLEEFLLEQSFRRRQLSLEEYLARRVALIEKSTEEGAARELALLRLVEDGHQIRLDMIEERAGILEGDIRRAYDNIDEAVRAGLVTEEEAQRRREELHASHVAGLEETGDELMALQRELRAMGDTPGADALIRRIEDISLAIRRATNDLGEFDRRAAQLEQSRRALELSQARAERSRIEGDPRLSPNERRRHLVPALQDEDRLLGGSIDSAQTRLQQDGSLTPEERIQLEERVLQLQQEQVEVQNQLWRQQHQVQAAVSDWLDRLGTTAEQIGRAVTGVLDGIHRGMTTAFSGLLDGTMSLKDAWRSLGASFWQAMNQAIARMLADFVMSQGLMLARHAATKAKMFAVDVAFAAKSVALSVASAAKALVAWIPAAIAAGISSFGVAAAIGVAAVVGAIAAFGGFEKGGFTGAGGRSEPAGIVHRGEYVMPAPVVEALGLGTMQAIHASALSGGGFRDGGLAGSGAGGNRLAAAASNGGGGTNVNIAQVRDWQEERRWLEGDGMRIVIDQLNRRGNRTAT